MHSTVSKRFKLCFEERMTGCHNVNNVIRNCSSLRHFLISNFFLNSVQTQSATGQLWYIFAILMTSLYIHTPLPATNMKVIPEEMTSLFDINMSTLSYLKNRSLYSVPNVSLYLIYIFWTSSLTIQTEVIKFSGNCKVYTVDYRCFSTAYLWFWFIYELFCF